MPTFWQYFNYSGNLFNILKHVDKSRISYYLVFRFLGSCIQNVSIGTGSTIHTTPQSSSTVASTNPFEASFATLNRLRTASCSSGVIPLSATSVETDVAEPRHEKFSGDTTLNTPQIFTSKISNDESINTPQIFPTLQDVVSLPVTPAIQPSLPTSGFSSFKVNCV